MEGRARRWSQPDCNRSVRGFRSVYEGAQISMTKKHLLLPAAFLFACTFAAAQTDSGAIRVLVQDTSSAPVSGATVNVTNVATGILLSRFSESDGYATFLRFPMGATSLTWRKQDFKRRT